MSTNNQAAGLNYKDIVFYLLNVIVIAVYGLPIFYGFTVKNAGVAGVVPVIGGIFFALLSSSILYLMVRFVLARAGYSWKLLLLGFLWGASGIAFHSQLSQIISFLPETVLKSSVFDGGVMEELAKAIFLFALLATGARHFSKIGSGLLLGWFVGMGFSFVENISYFSGFIKSSVYAGLITRFIANLIGNHALYTGLSGVAIAWLIKKYSYRSLLWLWPLAILPGILLHSINNGLLNPFVGDIGGLLIGFISNLTMLVLLLRKARDYSFYSDNIPPEL